jgi:hypothetical protein
MRSVKNQISKPLWEQVRDKERIEVSNQVSGPVKDKVKIHVSNQIRSQVSNQLWYQVWTNQLLQNMKA